MYNLYKLLLGTNKYYLKISTFMTMSKKRDLLKVRCLGVTVPSDLNNDNAFQYKVRNSILTCLKQVTGAAIKLLLLM